MFQIFFTNSKSWDMFVWFKGKKFLFNKLKLKLQKKKNSSGSCFFSYCVRTKKDIGLNQKDIGTEIHYVWLKNITLDQTFIFFTLKLGDNKKWCVFFCRYCRFKNVLGSTHVAEQLLLPNSAPAQTSTELEAELVLFSCLYNHPSTNPPNNPGEFKFDLIWCQYQNKSCFIC